ncbi:capsular polysaccharide export protein [Kushneria sinocarnis]|uniref:Capsular polysaccharide export protein n=1 Tax=Kushneria sinocarnis TaxID=595502 RepID=A0A420WWX1_9GAMM|nr:capsular polysaccharide biosynthesis protein [Kushneria sinocarnis]RKR04252.1 capsular polysaccharide export protein [Kushneria sinocarnis]
MLKKKLLRFSKELKFVFEARKKKVWAVNVAAWKRPHFEKFIEEAHVAYVPLSVSEQALHRLAKWSKVKKIYIWGKLETQVFKDFLAAEPGIKVVRVEDGFIRSVGLGAQHVPPYSLCFDKTGIYFDATQPSDLENLLNNYDFDSDPELLKRAEKCIQTIVENDITKYNEAITNLAATLYGPKLGKRVLVIGQVEDDQSIQFGCDRPFTNNDLVRLASKENPEAQIIYKIHPDVLVGKREGLSNPDDVMGICNIISERMSLNDALTGVDRVYTISSLAGFESLLRGVAVTTVGCPFYAGWGITNDKQKSPRRNRNLTIINVFSASYILYPRYMREGQKVRIEEIVNEVKLKSTS